MQACFPEILLPDCRGTCLSYKPYPAVRLLLLLVAAASPSTCYLLASHIVVYLVSWGTVFGGTVFGLLGTVL